MCKSKRQEEMKKEQLVKRIEQLSEGLIDLEAYESELDVQEKAVKTATKPSKPSQQSARAHKAQ
jgi:hypothetical protein